MMGTRVGEETVVDIQLGGFMVSGGSRSGGERKRARTVCKSRAIAPCFAGGGMD